MNYQNISAIKLTGDLNTEGFKTWFKAYETWPLIVRLFPEWDATFMGFERLTVQQKEDCLRRAIRYGLKPEVVYLNESTQLECAYALPLTADDHPLLTHQEEGSIAFIRLEGEGSQLYFEEVGADCLAQWSLKLWKQLKGSLIEQSPQIQQEVSQRVIQRCTALKGSQREASQETQVILKEFNQLNRQRFKKKQSPHTVSLVLYALPNKEESRLVYGVLGEGSPIGQIHALFLLFAMMHQAPMLQEFVLQQFKKATPLV